MKIKSVDRSYAVSCKSLYFTKTSNVLFNPYSNYMNKDGVKISEFGYKYIEDSNIPKKIVEHFKANAFINTLKNDNDVFVLYKELSGLSGYQKKSKNNISMAKIIWSNLKSMYAEERLVMGSSVISQEDATEMMLSKLERKIFEKR